MADYKSLYYQLFNKVTEIIEELKEVQIEMEEMYIDGDIKNINNDE